MLLVINHQKGGVGKSTLSWNLAITFQKILNKQIEVVDLDVQQTITLSNYVRNQVGLQNLNIKTFKDAESFKKYIALDNDDKLIICDTGAYDSSLNRLAALAADMIITPLSNSTVELQGLKTYEKIIKDIQIKSGVDIIPFVVLNNIDPRTKNLEDIKNYIGKDGSFQVLDSVICRRTDFIGSITNGKSVQEYKENSKAAIEINALIEEIKSKLSI
ncbi:MAG: ParA family protein [Sulfuricurvum sp.]|jgi:chromosome partitioning protein|uniref:ParA family protein n=1 Tax=Sulfuricurvum sp. TaxID=2025608 RepID=UPI0025E97B2D|nr:ParA family protein [Sulfuricurvum sp.]MCK9372478.1 ParA family protein [Sulfuricurvum sp.]